MAQPGTGVREAKKVSTGWPAHIHLSTIKQLSFWTPQGLLRRSASNSRSGSPRPLRASEADKNGKEADLTADSHEVKESLLHLLSGCYHDAAGCKRKNRRGRASARYDAKDSLYLATTTSSPSSSTPLTPMTSDSSEEDDEDEEDEEEDNASDSHLSLSSSRHSDYGLEDETESPDDLAGDGYTNNGPGRLATVTARNESDILPGPLYEEPASTSRDAVETLAEQSPAVDGLILGGIQTLAFVEKKAGRWPARAGQEDEVLIASVPAIQCRTVMIKGTLYLTNKRLIFYAWLALDKEEDETTILQHGVLTFVYPQKLKANRRVYCVLSPYGIVSYNSATDKLHPRSARSLSAFKQITMDPKNPLRFRVEEINGSYRWVYTDTEEHTRQWYNAMQAALFRYRFRSDQVVTSIPLSRVESFRLDDIMDFCKVMQLDVNCATSDDMPRPEDEMRQVVFGVTRQSWQILPEIEQYLEKNKLPEVSRATLLPKEPEVVISYDKGERRNEIDQIQSSSRNLAADFVRAFGLEDKPEDLHIASVDVLRPYPDYGHIAVSRDYLCFWRKSIIGEDSKARISMSTIDDVFASKNYRLRVYSMTVQVRAEKDVKFEYHSKKIRDECIEQIEQRLEQYHERRHIANLKSGNSREGSPTVITPMATMHKRPGSHGSFTQEGPGLSKPTTTSSDSTYALQMRSTPERQASMADPNIRVPPRAIPCLGTIINLPAEAMLKIPSRHFVLMTIGSRGDVQPYIALGKRLVQEGHRVTIASHEEYQGWAESHGLQYKCIGGSPTALMQLSVEHKMFSPGFFRESLGKFRDWFDDLLQECWAACQDAEILIESPTAFAGIHIAEALAIPYFRAFTMPWTSTAAYPQAFAPMLEAGGAYNSLSYSIFDKVLWQASAGQINRWRKHVLGIKRTTFEKMQQRKVPFIYNFSQAVVPPPLDWSSLIRISGYWFLDQPDTDWIPEAPLLEFMQRARNDNVPLIYAGFGSITIKDVEIVVEHIYEAALSADVRVILSKGWSARGKDGKERSIQLKYPPPNVFLVDSIPHDWLFPKVDAAMHHGGAGTTGASLRAGLPTIIKPFFGDQFFWSTRVQKLGVGIRLQSLAASDIAKAFTLATRNRIMQERAEDVGKRIRAEDGCGEAIRFVYGLLSTAERQAKERHSKSVLHKVAKDTRNVNSNDELSKLHMDRLKEVTLGYSPPSRSCSLNRNTRPATPVDVQI